jgi:hypothetical protein
VSRKRPFFALPASSFLKSVVCPEPVLATDCLCGICLNTLSRFQLPTPLFSFFFLVSFLVCFSRFLQRAGRTSSRQSLTKVRKRHFLSHLYIKINILPRQARDEHRESTQKIGRFPSGIGEDTEYVKHLRGKKQSPCLVFAMPFHCMVL